MLANADYAWALWGEMGEPQHGAFADFCGVSTLADFKLLSVTH